MTDKDLNCGTQIGIWPQPLSPENHLIVLAKKGDATAYSELYRQNAKRIFRTILKVTGNREDAEDVLQEAAMKALIHLDKFEGRSAFSTWLTRIAINAALMMRRKKSSRLEQSIGRGDGQDSFYELPAVDRALNAEDLLRVDERDRQIQSAIERLPPILRLPLQLQIVEDLPVKELASRLGISVAATKTRLLRARAQVGRAIAGSQGVQTKRPASRRCA